MVRLTTRSSDGTVKCGEMETCVTRGGMKSGAPPPPPRWMNKSEVSSRGNSDYVASEGSGEGHVNHFKEGITCRLLHDAKR